MVTVLLFLAVSAWLALRFNGIAFLSGIGSNTGRHYLDPIEVDQGSIPPDASYAVQFVIAGTSLSTLIAISFGVGAAIFPLKVVAPKPRIRLALRAGAGRTSTAASAVKPLWEHRSYRAGPHPCDRSGSLGAALVRGCIAADRAGGHRRRITPPERAVPTAGAVQFVTLRQCRSAAWKLRSNPG